MDGYNFSERVRRVLMSAREEAVHRSHYYVGPEHMLLGLLAQHEGVAAMVLQNHQIDLDAFNRSIAPGDTATVSGPDLPYTRDAKRVLEHAMQEASRLQHSYVGTEHLLLGVLSVKGVSSEFLRAAGITLDTARDEIVALLGPPIDAQSRSRQREQVVGRDLGVPVSVTVMVEYSGGTITAHKFSRAHDAQEYVSTLRR